MKSFFSGQKKTPGSKDMVTADRRRLTVGAIEDQSANASSSSAAGRPDTNRGLVQFLKKNNLLELAAGTNAAATSGDVPAAQINRRGSFTISSVTSNKQDAFAEKKCTCEGDGADKLNHQALAEHGIGIRCKKGFKPEAPNQDSFAFINAEGDFKLFGVFDGHGTNGHDISNFTREMLPKLFISDQRRETDPKAALVDAFAKTQQLIVADPGLDARTSGSTATLAYWKTGSDEIYIAHCGDSRAVVMYEKGGKACGADLTVDHKPNLPAEKKRIEENGGCVIFDGFYNHRVFKRGTVFPGLNMSRAFGDVIGHTDAGITEKPDIRVLKLDGKNSYLALALCSDGVWEFIDANEAAQIVLSQRDKKGKVNPMTAAEELAKISWNHWMEDTCGEISDDITVVLQVFETK